MLQITRQSVWRSTYDIHSRGKLLAVWKKETWKAGGLLTVGPHVYVVKSSILSSKHTLFDQSGGTLGVAERVGRKNWTISGNGQVYQMRRASIWRGDQELLMNGRPAGYISRRGGWSFAATVELDPLPLPLQMFAIAVVLMMWEQATAAAGA